MRSVRTRTPPGRTERRTVAPPASPASVCPEPASPAAIRGRGTAPTSGVDGGVGGARIGGARVGRGVVRSGLAVGEHRDQRELAPRVDLADLDLDLLAHPEHVLDVLD